MLDELLGKFEIRIRTISLTNSREHWSKKASRALQERGLAHFSWLAHFRIPRPKPPLRITLIRVAPRRLDDDNLRAALKSVRDGLADALRIDDRDTRVKWRYAQCRHREPRYYSVLVLVRRMEAP